MPALHCIAIVFELRTELRHSLSYPSLHPSQASAACPHVWVSDVECGAMQTDKGWPLALAMFCLGRVVIRVFQEVTVRIVQERIVVYTRVLLATRVVLSLRRS